MMDPMPASPSPAPASPNEPVTRARQGDVAAFEALYRQHTGRIYALCLRMTGTRTAAEELTQQVFVRAWERLGSFRGDADFGTWLHRLAINVVLGDRRATGRRVARFEQVADPDRHPALPRPDGTSMDLEQAIATLPPKARAVFVLHDVQGLTHPEIAQAMGIDAGTSKGQLHRARQLLREVLA